MSELSMKQKILVGTFAWATVLGPVVFGAVSAEAQGDRDIIPLVRINPDYPTAALESRREGSVILEFTITTTGTVKDAAVVESSDPVFEPSALAALTRWRYEPQLRDGQPVERRGVRTVIRFALQP